MIDRLKTNRRKTAYHITRATKGASANIAAGVAVWAVRESAPGPGVGGGAGTGSVAGVTARCPSWTFIVRRS